MRFKNLTIPQHLSIILSLMAVITAFLVFSKSYFNNTEINTLVDGCLEADGEPTVEVTTLHLNYSFSCE